MKRSNINIYNQDCMEAMAGMEDNQFDLAIVDPPYGIGDFEQGAGKQKKHKKWKIEWNKEIPATEYFNELLRVSKKHIIWGANYYNCFTTGGAIIWYKKVTHPSMSKCEIASTNIHKKVEYFEHEWNGFLRACNEKSMHPCQKPVALYKWLLKNYAKEGDKIVDTHVGSMSIALACWDLGFDLEAYELDKDYYKAGMKRFNAHTSQRQFANINI